ncbi:integral membrane protein [Xylariaceae sp. FL0662B]|nr:integral membrane protein [Xylariaceae sp. FL0662B]
MQLPPASVLNSWPTPNYVDPETRGPAAKIAGTLFASTATIILAIRLYARKWLTRGFGLDDVLILLAYVPSTAFVITGLIAEDRFQWNRHTWDVRHDLFISGLQLALADMILFDLATTLTKLSMLAMVHRLTTASKNRKMSVIVLILMAIIGINGVIFIMIAIFQCSPVSDYWTLSAKRQHCIDERAHMLAASIINTVTDFIVVLVPIKTVLGLNLPTKQRRIVIGLFGVGVVASSAGIARAYFTQVLTTAEDYDTTWNSWVVWFSSAIELYLGIICASIPATKPFFAKYLPGLGSTIRSRSSMMFPWDARPSKKTRSMASPISHNSSSSSSGLLLQRPAPLLTHQHHQHHQHHKHPSDLNKPLPPIAYDRPADFETHSPLSDDFSVRPLSPRVPSPQRAGVRFTNRYTLVPSGAPPRDHTTVFILYQGDGDDVQGRAQPVPSRASFS